MTLDLPPTRVANLQLKEEQEAMVEGYRFLDEKRLILAAEILAELACYRETLAAFRIAYDQAARQLRLAIERQGLEGIELYPPAAAPGGRFELSHRSVLGVEIQTLEWQLDPLVIPPAVEPSPEAEACRKAFRTLLPQIGRMAAHRGNLERLRQDYLRASRRARALEDVLLPEVAKQLAAIDAVLEEQEREEAVRVRGAHGRC